MGPWSDAVVDILQVNAEKLDHHSDYLRFGAVCKLWRFVYMENHHRLPYKLPLCFCHPRQLAVPLLLRSCKPDADSREFICLSDEKVYGGFFLPEAANKWICGSSWGWLVTVDIDDEEIHLLNPLTRAQIRLPPLRSFTRHAREALGDPDESIDFIYIRKAIISADPSTHSSDCVVVAITGNFLGLSYCRVGDTKWTNVEESPTLVQDIIYHDGIFYAIEQYGVVVAFDSLSPDAVGTIIVGNTKTMEAMEIEEVVMMKYLVMSSGVLLKVAKVVDHKTSRTIQFNVYKLQKSESPIYGPVGYSTTSLREFQTQEEIFHKWVKLESLGDQMLLLGINSSMSLPAHLFPNFKSGCIYFTDDFVEKHYLNLDNRQAEVIHDAGVFDMHEGSIQSYCLEGPTFVMPSIWVTSNIC